MNAFHGSYTGPDAAAWLVPLGVACLAVFAGTATAVVGGQAGYKSVYYAGVFGLLGASALIAVTRDEPMRLVYLALLLCFPLVNVLVPPGRFGLKVFDVVTIAAALVFIGKRILAGKQNSEPLFPGRSIALAWLLGIPSVAYSLFPSISIKTLIVVAGVYAFFLMTLRELQRDRGFACIISLLAIAMLMIDIALLIDYLFHINLSLRGSNLNQFSFTGGIQVWRAGGFFQDPQLAGAFLACSITFMLILLTRGRFHGSRLRNLVALAVLFSFAGILTTISRGAIIACVVLSALALFIFNRWSPPIKAISVGALLTLVLALASIPPDTLLQLAPPTVAERFDNLGESIDQRLMIWFDTWDMFAENPLTGIGMNSFRPYLLETRPGVVNYYGIGAGTGILYVPNQPENGYLKILYEGGLSGAIAVLVFVGDTVRRALAIIRVSARDSDERTEAIAALAGLATFAITFTTLFTWTDARIAGLFMIMTGVIWSRSIAPSQPAASAMS